MITPSIQTYPKTKEEMTNQNIPKYRRTSRRIGPAFTRTAEGGTYDGEPKNHNMFRGVGTCPRWWSEVLHLTVMIPPKNPNPAPTKFHTPVLKPTTSSHPQILIPPP